MKRRPWKLVLAAGLVAAAGCVALSFTIGCGPVRGYVPSGDYVTLRHDCADRPLYLIAAATVLAITLAVAAWIARWRLPRPQARRRDEPRGGWRLGPRRLCPCARPRLPSDLLRGADLRAQLRAFPSPRLRPCEGDCVDWRRRSRVVGLSGPGRGCACALPPLNGPDGRDGSKREAVGAWAR
jgi:hypothetical protein